MDGEGEDFLAYGFVRSAYQIYIAPEVAKDVPPPQIQADLFEMIDADGACGIYLYKTEGFEGEPAGIGDASMLGAKSMHVWRGRWLLLVEADAPFPKDVFVRIGREAVERLERDHPNLPKGREPSTLALLPPEGLETTSRVFVRRRLSFDEKFIWGLEGDCLGLDRGTVTAAIGRYEVQGKAAALLAAARYPNGTDAEAALSAVLAACKALGMKDSEADGGVRRFDEPGAESLSMGILREGTALFVLLTPDWKETARILAHAREQARANLSP